VLSNGAEFHSPEERIREYCEIEVYRDVGYRGGYDDHLNVTDTVTAEDLEAANSLRADMTVLDRKRILGKATIPARLAAVKDCELGEIPAQEWEGVKATIEPLLAEFLSIRNIDLAKTTKVLHLKRPHLFPILDPCLVKFLTKNEMENRFVVDETLKIAMDCLEIARDDIIRNSATFAELQKQLADLPTPLTAVRVYDILCWTQERWVNRGITTAPRGTASRSLDQGERRKVEAPPPTPPVGETAKPAEEREPEGGIVTVKEFRQIMAKAEGVIVITGSKPPRAHTPFCDLLTDDRFNQNVVIGEGRSAKYYWRGSLIEARREFGAVPCKKCRPAEAIQPVPDG